MRRELTRLERDLIEDAVIQYRHYKGLLEFFGIDPNEYALDGERSKEIPTIDGTKIKFIDFVVSLFDDGVPRTTVEIKEAYEKATGILYKITNFSSKLNMQQIRSKKIKNVVYPQFPLVRRGWWGKTEWFMESGDLKEEYKNKIPEMRMLNLM